MKILKNTKGQGLVEYVLIIAGVVIVALVAIWAFGGSVTEIFERITGVLNSAEPGSSTPGF